MDNTNFAFIFAGTLEYYTNKILSVRFNTGFFVLRVNDGRQILKNLNISPFYRECIQYFPEII